MAAAAMTLLAFAVATDGADPTIPMRESARPSASPRSSIGKVLKRALHDAYLAKA